MIQAQIVYIIWCLWWALANYIGIRFANVWIFHGMNGLLHGSVWYGMVLISKDYSILIACPFVGKLFFDVALSKMRGLSISYIPEKPKSILDRVEKVIFFNNGIAAKITYATIIILFNAYHHFRN